MPKRQGEGGIVCEGVCRVVGVVNWPSAATIYFAVSLLLLFLLSLYLLSVVLPLSSPMRRMSNFWVFGAPQQKTRITWNYLTYFTCLPVVFVVAAAVVVVVFCWRANKFEEFSTMFAFHLILARFLYISRRAVVVVVVCWKNKRNFRKTNLYTFAAVCHWGEWSLPLSLYLSIAVSFSDRSCR